MLLQRLKEYSKRIPSTPSMYGKMVIKWIIDIDMDGQLQGIIPTSDGEKKNDKGKSFLAPHIGRASGIKAKLLADNGEYVLGKARKDSDTARVKECNRAFVELIKKAAECTNESTIYSILKFYEHTNCAELILKEDFDPSQNLTFRINGILPIDLPSIQKFWSGYTGEETNSKDGDVRGKDIMQCLICGEEKPAIRRLPFKIKRIPGGQTAGTAMISANSPAFESYGLEESLIAPTCQECGERFSKAANSLLEGENTHITAGKLVYIFWTKEETGFSFASILSKPEPGEVKMLVKSVFSGKKAAVEIDSTPFYATAFSASGARVAVRDWLETTVSNAQENLARWFKLQQIVDVYTGDETLPSPIKGYFGKDKKWISGIIDDLAPEVKRRRDINGLSPNIFKVLIHAALNGGALPMWLLYQAVRRNRAEQKVTISRAVLIKMVLQSQNNNFIEEDKMEQIDLENRNPAYLCGRLLGVIESVQMAAIPGAKATVVDRFFGTASSAPASVFGRLLRGAQFHLSKLRKEKRGTFEALEKKLDEVQSGLNSFPKTLTLEDQGRFALGYYHQRAADRAGAIAYKQSQQEEKNRKLDTESSSA
ncbi:MAG: type I-C CRISPR-associated protein Cas8c/Csd1 [Candidatus Brocadia sp.]|nr:type I-C CRISPR-associated protein Cas8c/Csd1 [Candidatus Brocadia sp.]